MEKVPIEYTGCIKIFLHILEANSLLRIKVKSPYKHARSCGPVPWPPRSPALDTLDSCPHGHLKQLTHPTRLYQTPLQYKQIALGALPDNNPKGFMSGDRAGHDLELFHITYLERHYTYHICVECVQSRVNCIFHSAIFHQRSQVTIATPTKKKVGNKLAHFLVR